MTTTKAQRDALFDAVQAEFGIKAVTRRDATRIGRIVSDLLAHNATPDDLKARIAAYRKAWPRIECTPEAMVKHWQRFAPPAPPKPEDAWLNGLPWGGHREQAIRLRDRAAAEGVLDEFLRRVPTGYQANITLEHTIDSCGGVAAWVNSSKAGRPAAT